MLKNALFGIIATAVGAPLQPSVGLRRLSALPLDPQVVIPIQFTCDFRELRRFLDIDKIKISTYFMHEWQLVGPFAKFTPWLKPLVTPLLAAWLENRKGHFADTLTNKLAKLPSTKSTKHNGLMECF